MDAKPLAMIIEDSEDQNLVFTKAMELAGYATESILDGTRAQVRLKEALPELVILDLHIPGVNGGILLRQIRSDRRLEHMRVILATADAAMAAALETQADLVLLKPISFSQLTQLASRYIQHPKSSLTPGD